MVKTAQQRALNPGWNHELFWCCSLESDKMGRLSFVFVRLIWIIGVLLGMPFMSELLIVFTCIKISFRCCIFIQNFTSSVTWLCLNGMLKRGFDLSCMAQLYRRPGLTVMQRSSRIYKICILVTIRFSMYIQCSLKWCWISAQFIMTLPLFLVLLTVRLCAIDLSLSPFWKSHKSLTSKVKESSILIQLFSAFKQVQICCWLSEPLCNGLERTVDFLCYCENTHPSADPYWRLWISEQ